MHVQPVRAAWRSAAHGVARCSRTTVAYIINTRGSGEASPSSSALQGRHGAVGRPTGRARPRTGCCKRVHPCLHPCACGSHGCRSHSLPAFPRAGPDLALKCVCTWLAGLGQLGGRSARGPSQTARRTRPAAARGGIVPTGSPLGEVGCDRVHITGSRHSRRPRHMTTRRHRWCGTAYRLSTVVGCRWGGVWALPALAFA